MLLKNVASQGVYLFAYNASGGLAGDQANVTGTVSKDGSAPPAAFATAHPTNIGAGLYWQPLSQAETDCNAIGMAWSSTTSGVQIDPVTGFTGEVDAAYWGGVAVAGLPDYGRFLPTGVVLGSPTPTETAVAVDFDPLTPSNLSDFTGQTLQVALADGTQASAAIASAAAVSGQPTRVAFTFGPSAALAVAPTAGSAVVVRANP